MFCAKKHHLSIYKDIKNPSFFLDLYTRRYKSLLAYRIHEKCTRQLYKSSPCLKRRWIEVWRWIPSNRLVGWSYAHGWMVYRERWLLNMTDVGHGVVEEILRPVVDRVWRVKITLSCYGVLHVSGQLALPFCPTVLKPYLDLRFCELQCFRKLHSASYTEVFAFLELTLKGFDLLVCESSSWSFL